LAANSQSRVDRWAGRLAALTEREREVLGAIGNGLSNPELARALFLSESTVKTHVGRILQKLEWCDRVQAVILSHQESLA
jgi:DNA-binding NarL/FixJ family response regulator